MNNKKLTQRQYFDTYTKALVDSANRTHGEDWFTDAYNEVKSKKGSRFTREVEKRLLQYMKSFGSFTIEERAKLAAIGLEYVIKFTCVFEYAVMCDYATKDKVLKFLEDFSRNAMYIARPLFLKNKDNLDSILDAAVICLDLPLTEQIMFYCTGDISLIAPSTYFRKMFFWALYNCFLMAFYKSSEFSIALNVAYHNIPNDFEVCPGTKYALQRFTSDDDVWFEQQYTWSLSNKLHSEPRVNLTDEQILNLPKREVVSMMFADVLSTKDVNTKYKKFLHFYTFWNKSITYDFAEMTKELIRLNYYMDKSDEDRAFLDSISITKQKVKEELKSAPNDELVKCLAEVENYKERVGQLNAKLTKALKQLDHNTNVEAENKALKLKLSAAEKILEEYKGYVTDIEKCKDEYADISDVVEDSDRDILNNLNVHIVAPDLKSLRGESIIHGYLPKAQWTYVGDHMTSVADIPKNKDLYVFITAMSGHGTYWFWKNTITNRGYKYVLCPYTGISSICNVILKKYKDIYLTE